LTQSLKRNEAQLRDFLDGSNLDVSAGPNLTPRADPILTP